MYDKGKKPENNKRIRLHCEDWSSYIIDGMFIPYKPGSPKKLVGKSRFCTLDECGKYTSNRNAWKDCVSWEYINE